MKLRGNPADALALIVGVEYCDVFPDDPLFGPVQSAVDWAGHLLAWGLQPQRVQLFCSAKSASLPIVQAWRDAHPETPAVREPTAQVLRMFVVDTLPTLVPAGGSGALFVVWIGHGLINQRDTPRTRRLFFSDSTPSIADNLEVIGLAAALRSARYAAFTQQVLVVDACANYSVGFSGGRRLPQPTDLLLTAAGPAVEQLVLLAVAPGQVTQSTTGPSVRESVARFSHRLLRELGPPSAGAWPDLIGAFARVRATFEGRDATPVDWALGVPDDTLNDSQRLVLPDAWATRLLDAVRDVEDDLLRQAFYAALDGAVPTQTHHDAAAARDEMATLLCALPQAPDAPAPLARWAAQIDALVDDRQRHPELAAWLKRWPDASTRLPAYRDAALRASAAGSVCVLLIRETPSTEAQGSSRLAGWLFTALVPDAVELVPEPTAPLVDGTGHGRARALAVLIDAATRRARTAGIVQPELIIEMALPRERIDDAVEKLAYGSSDDDLRTLGRRYAIVRRLDERLSALARSKRRGEGPEIALWRKVAGDMAPRLAQHGLQLLWMDPQDIRDNLLPHHLKNDPRGSCVGLRRAEPGPKLAAALKSSLWVDGLPFACWSEAAWSDADTHRLHGELQHSRGALALHGLWRLALEAGWKDHPSVHLRLLWDDPARSPYDHRLEADR